MKQNFIYQTNQHDQSSYQAESVFSYLGLVFLLANFLLMQRLIISAASLTSPSQIVIFPSTSALLIIFPVTKTYIPYLKWVIGTFFFLNILFLDLKSFIMILVPQISIRCGLLQYWSMLLLSWTTLTIFVKNLQMITVSGSTSQMFYGLMQRKEPTW